MPQNNGREKTEVGAVCELVKSCDFERIEVRALYVKLHKGNQFDILDAGFISRWEFLQCAGAVYGKAP